MSWIRKFLSVVYRRAVAIKYLLTPAQTWRKYQRLEIGSGPIKRSGWLTLDYCRGADVVWNLNKRLPFPDGCFELIYSSHVLEHFEPKQLRSLLSEMQRVLKPGGVMSVCVPDASLYVRAYIDGDPRDLLRHEPAILSDCPMDYLNYIFYMDGHHHMMFDEKSLRWHVTQAGFREFRMRAFDPTMDSEVRQYESMYAECVK